MVSAFNLCPFNEVKVVLIGQDPYHGDVRVSLPFSSVCSNSCVCDRVKLKDYASQVSRELEWCVFMCAFLCCVHVLQFLRESLFLPLFATCTRSFLQTSKDSPRLSMDTSRSGENKVFCCSTQR